MRRGINAGHAMSLFDVLFQRSDEARAKREREQQERALRRKGRRRGRSGNSPECVAKFSAVANLIAANRNNPTQVRLRKQSEEATYSHLCHNVLNQKESARVVRNRRKREAKQRNRLAKLVAV